MLTFQLCTRKIQKVFKKVLSEKKKKGSAFLFVYFGKIKNFLNACILFFLILKKAKNLMNFKNFMFKKNF